MGALVLDASAVVAFLDTEDAHSSTASRAIRAAADAGDDLLLPASAYAETLVHPMRAGRGDEVDSFIDVARISVVPLERPIARLAASLRAEHRSLRLGDALVLATAQSRDAALLTFDSQLERLATR